MSLSLIKPLVTALLFTTVCRDAFCTTATCVGDGVTDVTDCLQQALHAAALNLPVSNQVFITDGTYIINRPLIVPPGVHFVGAGRGDAGYIGTVIQAGSSFPQGNPVIKMGLEGVPGTDVLVAQMTIDGEGRANYALEDISAGDRSRGEHLSLFNFQAAGLHVEGPGASGAGPFLDLEIYPLEFATTSSNCILVHDVPFFAGVTGATCNAGNSMGVRPSVAVQVDGNGVYDDIHIESYVMGYQLGSSTPVDGIVVRNAQLGPNVDTALTITASPGNQNIAIFGVNCYSCSLTLNDLVTGVSQYWPVGWYLEGSGLPVSSRKLLSSNADTTNNLGSTVFLTGNVSSEPADFSNVVQSSQPHSQLRTPIKGRPKMQ